MDAQSKNEWQWGEWGSLIERLAAGEEIDCDAIRRQMEIDPENFRSMLDVRLRARLKKEELEQQQVVYREFLPASVFYCLIAADPRLLGCPVVQRQIEYWRMKVKGLRKGRDVFSEKLRRIGRALDPAQRGNVARDGEMILFAYEKAIELIEEIQRDFRALRLGPVRNYRIRAAELSETKRYKGLDSEFIEDIARGRNCHEKALALVADWSGMSVDTVKKTVSREGKEKKRPPRKKSKTSACR